MFYMRVTKWSLTESSNSPGWLTSNEMFNVLANPSLVPPEFYNEVIYANYLNAYLDIIGESSAYQGLLGYKIFNTDKFSVLSLAQFDSLESLNDYLALFHSRPSYTDVYVPARDAMLGLLNVSMDVYSPIETDIPINVITESEVRQLIL